MLTAQDLFSSVLNSAIERHFNVAFHIVEKSTHDLNYIWPSYFLKWRGCTYHFNFKLVTKLGQISTKSTFATFSSEKGMYWINSCTLKILKVLYFLSNCFQWNFLNGVWIPYKLLIPFYVLQFSPPLLSQLHIQFSHANSYVLISSRHWQQS